ncbi:SOS response-associated peptidase [soil metagenome]
MCGRFVSASSPESIAEYFGAAFDGETLEENHNVAPTADVYAVVADDEGHRRVDAFRWGLVPSWAKDIKVGARMINARSETLAEKPAFKGVFGKHRCLIPMDGFYEWTRTTVGDAPPTKQPVFIHRRDGELLAVAGLWAAWRPQGDDDAEWLHSASVITTSANATMAPVHDRMPVILPESAWAEWLDPNMHDTGRLRHLFVPANDGLLTMYSVSTEVNNARNKGAHLMAPMGTADQSAGGPSAGE